MHLVKEGQVLSKDSKSSEKFIHDIKLLVAKNYIDNLSEEVRKGMNEKAEEGIWPSCAPIGYTNVLLSSGKHGIASDEHRTDLVRRLFALYATGNYSLKDLTKWAREHGLTFRKSGLAVNKATIHGMLRNLICTGKFVWDGKEYDGVHEPIISRELWERVQSILDHRYSNHYRVIKHDLPFSGLIRCGHCGCAVVGDIKKGKYIYYRCTHQRGMCPDKYVRQETLDAQFCEAIGRIALPAPFVQWAEDVLRASNADDLHLHEESITQLSLKRERIQKRLEAMYIDKLEGRITAEMFDRFSNEWRHELEQLDQSIEAHRTGGRSNIPEGIQILELVSGVRNLFEQQPAHEKRKLLNFVVSNSTWKDGRLTVQYRQPFDLFSTWEETMKEEPNTGGLKNGQN